MPKQAALFKKKSSFWTARAPVEKRILTGYRGHWQLKYVDDIPIEKRIKSRLIEWRIKDRRKLEKEYLSYVTNLDDHSLFGELSYWHNRVREAKVAIPYAKGSPQDKFLKEMLEMQFFIHKRPAALSGSRWRNLVTLCIALRSLVIGPSLPFKESRRDKPTEFAIKLRQKALRFESDWEIIQRIASHIGSVDFSPHEFDFTWREWKKANASGPNAFSFGFEVTRNLAERILVEVKSRPNVLRRDQIALFKKMIGRSTVKLWNQNLEFDFMNETTADRQ
jgi:hypothetical protein